MNLPRRAYASTFAELVWAQLHFGLTPDLAAECLLLIGAVLLTLPLLALTGERRGGDH